MAIVIVTKDLVKGYKIFEPDWKCRGFQYKVGETHKYDGNLILCAQGFHFCHEAIDCLQFYSTLKGRKFAEVTGEDETIVDILGKKCVTRKITIVREIPIDEMKLLCTGTFKKWHDL